MSDEGAPGRQRARHQRFANEDLARRGAVDRAERDTPARHQRQPVQLDPFAGHHFAAALVPVRLEVLAGDPLAGNRLDPLGLDTGRHPRVQALRLDQLRGEHPARRLLREARARVQHERESAGPLVALALGIPGTDVRQQPGQQRLMDRLVAPRVDGCRQRGRPLPAELGELARELPVDVAPLGEAQERHELRTAGVDALAVRQPLPVESGEELPQRDQRQEVGALVAEPQMRLVGRLLLLEGPVARVRHRQRRGDDQHLGKAAALAGREHHPADPRVDRQPREIAAQRGQPARVVDGAEFLQQLVAVGDRTRARRLEKRERLDVAEVQRGHAQDHGRQRAAQDLRIGVARSRRVVVLVIEPDADAGGDATAAPRALVRRSLGDLLDLQQRRLVAQRVALDARKPAVDDVADARDGQRGLGYVGREHHAPPPRRREHALLLRDRQPRIQRQDLDGSRVRTARERAAQEFRGFADLAFAGQEHQDVAGAFAPEILRRADDRVLEFLLVVGLPGRDVAARAQRPPADVDGIGPAGHLDHRRRPVDGAEVARKALRVQRGRRHDDLEVGALRQQCLQIAQQEVDVEAALVRLVDDDRVVGRQEAVAGRLGEQDAVGHQLHERVGLRVVGEAHLVADVVAQFAAEFLRDARRDRACRNASRLGVADEAPLAPAQRQADLGQLRRLARARLAADDHDLVVADRGGDLVGPLRDRQVVRVDDRRPARGPGAAALDRARDRGLEALPLGGRRAAAAGALDPPGERQRIDGHAFGEGGEQAGGGGRGWHGGSRSGADSTPQPARPL